MPHRSFLALLLALVASPAEAALIPKPDGLPGEDPRAAPRREAVALPAIARAAGMRPGWEGAVRPGVWLVPAIAGTANVGRPAWVLEGGAWKGDWGVEGAVTAFGETRAPFRDAPYFQAQTLLVDLLVSRRLSPGPFRLFGGYRGLGLGDVRVVTLGGAVEQALRQPGFRLVARAQIGANFVDSAIADVQAGLGYQAGAFGLEAGLRHMALSAAGDPWFHLTGPTISLTGRF